jgi:hypothetical protein
MRCDFLVGSLLPNLQMMDYFDHGKIYNIHLISNIISSEEVKPKSKVLSIKEAPECKLKKFGL